MVCIQRSGQMCTVRVTCDVNFTQESEIDKGVDKALKMFKQRFDSKATHLDDDSNSKRVYTYRHMSNDEVRILKKLLKTKGAQILLSGVESFREDGDSDLERDGANKRGKDKNRARRRGATPPPSVRTETSVTSSVDGSIMQPGSGSSSQGSDAGDEQTQSELIGEARELCTRLQVLLDRIG